MYALPSTNATVLFFVQTRRILHIPRLTDFNWLIKLKMLILVPSLGYLSTRNRVLLLQFFVATAATAATVTAAIAQLAVPIIGHKLFEALWSQFAAHHELAVANCVVNGLDCTV